MKTLLISSLITLSTISFAGEDHKDMPKPKVSTEFESMKALVGTWTGKTKMHGQEMDTTVSYKLTSAETVLVETINPGTPMEMVTMYASQPKGIKATHYCALGNQPEMTLKKATGNTFTFEMVGNKGIADKNEMHMHAVTLTVEGNKLTQDWTNYNKNKKEGNHKFELTKKM